MVRGGQGSSHTLLIRVEHLFVVSSNSQIVQNRDTLYATEFGGNYGEAYLYQHYVNCRHHSCKPFRWETISRCVNCFFIMKLLVNAESGGKD